MKIKHIVTPQEDGFTLQHVLRSVMCLSSRETRNAKAQNGITVDGAPFFSNQKVHAGMTICVQLESYQPSGTPYSSALPPVNVIYEDESLIAVYKPALLQCHPSPSAPGRSDTLEGRVSAYLRTPAHPVHRLDAETTGIVLFAKLPYAQAHLQRQMQEGLFRKSYEAWCFGRPDQNEAIIDAPIEREHPDSFTRIVTPDGQHAVSRYAVQKSCRIDERTIVSLLTLSPLTGRTHQLRVHMTHIGCPLLGDTRYFSAESKLTSDLLKLSYHQLSAVSLTFTHPISGESVSLSHPATFAFDPAILAASP